MGPLEIHAWEFESAAFVPECIIDIRSSEQFARAHLHNAHNIPYEQFQVEAAVVARGAEPALVVDEGGARAAEMAVWLRTRGVDASYLSGGMSAWRGALEVQ